MEGVSWLTVGIWSGGYILLYTVLKMLAYKWRNERLEKNNRELRRVVYGNNGRRNCKSDYEDTEKERPRKTT